MKLWSSTTAGPIACKGDRRAHLDVLIYPRVRSRRCNFAFRAGNPRNPNLVDDAAHSAVRLAVLECMIVYEERVVRRNSDGWSIWTCSLKHPVDVQLGTYPIIGSYYLVPLLDWMVNRRFGRSSETLALSLVDEIKMKGNSIVAIGAAEDSQVVEIVWCNRSALLHDLFTVEGARFREHPSFDSDLREVRQRWVVWHSYIIAGIGLIVPCISVFTIDNRGPTDSTWVVSGFVRHGAARRLLKPPIGNSIVVHPIGRLLRDDVGRPIGCECATAGCKLKDVTACDIRQEYRMSGIDCREDRRGARGLGYEGPLE